MAELESSMYTYLITSCSRDYVTNGCTSFLQICCDTQKTHKSEILTETTENALTNNNRKGTKK